jgi:Nucleotidyl transferase AbiEii toxin, Type IV TA system
MSGNTEALPPVRVPRELADVVRAGIRANREVPGSVALGGAICALFCNHRASRDIDFVVDDLDRRFQKIREHLLELPGWRETRVRVPVLTLGSLDGIEVGYRQLRRTAPLETQEIQTPEGTLVVPTLDELLRVKAFLTYDRDCTRDFVDFAELSSLLDPARVVDALSVLDEKFRWEKQPSVIVEVIKALLHPDPHDRETDGFETLRLLDPKWRTWEEVAERCRDIGRRLSIRILGE